MIQSYRDFKIYRYKNPENKANRQSHYYGKRYTVNRVWERRSEEIVDLV